MEARVAKSEVSGRWLGSESSKWSWTGQARAHPRARPTEQGLGRRGMEKSLWQGKVGSCQGQKGTLRSGKWADSNSGFLSFRWQLLANNAQLVWGRQLSKPRVSTPPT